MGEFHTIFQIIDLFTERKACWENGGDFEFSTPRRDKILVANFMLARGKNWPQLVKTKWIGKKIAEGIPADVRYVFFMFILPSLR